MTRRRYVVVLGAGAAALAVVLFAVFGVLVRPTGGSAADTSDPVPVGGGVAATTASGDALSLQIAGLQQQLRRQPHNPTAWATLALAYVQQARATVNPAYYPKAEGAVRTSIAQQPVDNFIADAGAAALASARHDFAASLTSARDGLGIDPYNATLYGAEADALTQLGRYGDAAEAVQHMLDLRPDTSSLSRASYVFELRGDLTDAVAQMRRALDDAATPADAAFADYYLGELALNQGDARGALSAALDGLRHDATYSALLEEKAKAEVALGLRDAALADFAAVVAAVPQPQYIVEYGDYLQSLGRTADADRQYALFDTENRLFTANGVELDTDPTLFYADHGKPALALRYGRAGIAIRPFVEMDDAYAWALHANHRDSEALTWARKAVATGMRNALFRYHLGAIEATLGNRPAARRDLALALAINPNFNPLQAPKAEQLLQQMGGHA